MRIKIINYGAGNLFSIKKALETISNGSVNIVSRAESLYSTDVIILPGVGNFTTAVKVINKLRGPIVKLVNDNCLLVGICLGMQLLFNRSEEGYGLGLSLIDGDVVKLPNIVKTPHIGWNTIKKMGTSIIFDSLSETFYGYFAHSYYSKPLNTSVVIAETEYGITFPSIIEHNNIIGFQFHPEKSGRNGYILLSNALKMAKR